MIRPIYIGLAITVVVVVLPLTAALAHGEPVISVEPAVVAAGGQITVTGSEMEPGEVFTISLENAMSSFPLGESL